MNPSVLMFDAAYPPPVVGGKEKQAHLLSKELTRKGFTVSVLSFQHNGNHSQTFESIPITRIPNDGLRFIKLVVLLTLKRGKHSILHIHTPSRSGILATLVGKLLNYKVVFKFPNTGIISINDSINRTFWWLLKESIDLPIALEFDTLQSLKRLNFPQRDIFYANNGISILPLQIKGHHNQTIKFIFVGRLVAQKGVDTLLNACSLLSEERVDWELTIVGDGPERKALSEFTRKLEIESRVHFTGNVKTPQDYMINSNILVLASHKEGMSNVILEAMSIALPVVATNVGSAKKQLGTFSEEYTVPPRNPTQLANTLIKLALNPTNRRTYGRYLYERANTIFSISSVCDSYILRYKRLTRTENPKPTSI